MYRAKDFIVTEEGLAFAVVDNRVEEDKVLCFLRYVLENGTWRKLSTETANARLQAHSPEYLHYSQVLDAQLHAVPQTNVVQHFKPERRLQALLKQADADEVIKDLQVFCRLLQDEGVQLENIGVTGSLIIGAQHADSDLDLVFYDRKVFQQTRSVLADLIKQNKCQGLREQDWEQSWQRRDCELSLEEYIWHEQRKFNKVMINGRKVDLSLLIEEAPETEIYSKRGPVAIRVQVTDDSQGFDYPARFNIQHPEMTEIVCFSATYTGQAKAGEWVDVSGLLEASADGRQRIIVGSTREARGEFIRVVAKI